MLISFVIFSNVKPTFLNMDKLGLFTLSILASIITTLDLYFINNSNDLLIKTED